MGRERVFLPCPCLLCFLAGIPPRGRLDQAGLLPVEHKDWGRGVGGHPGEDPAFKFRKESVPALEGLHI